MSLSSELKLSDFEKVLTDLSTSTSSPQQLILGEKAWKRIGVNSFGLSEDEVDKSLTDAKQEGSSNLLYSSYCKVTGRTVEVRLIGRFED